MSEVESLRAEIKALKALTLMPQYRRMLFERELNETTLSVRSINMILDNFGSYREMVEFVSSGQQISNLYGFGRATTNEVVQWFMLNTMERNDS